MFDDDSRYKDAPTYILKDSRGRRVRVVAVPAAAPEVSVGVHLRKEGQRLDHLAFRYLKNASGYWRIAELNGVMDAEQLSEVLEVEIPRKER